MEIWYWFAATTDKANNDISSFGKFSRLSILNPSIESINVILAPSLLIYQYKRFLDSYLDSLEENWKEN